ncbi:hypothetical protein WR25_04212 [Diploscapter pachys]|uniref:DFDF domain-containing protein n=1 Tax=Diploscapter pachys TaxID=2018661 RepID=A0A2A2K1D0_9BILA|nr:hypothetical protein WR25_04212 [Diploscapter pachys]
MSASELVGAVVAIDCGGDEYYQGKLSQINASTKAVTLSSAFRNGVPLGKEITLDAYRIQDIKILKIPDQPGMLPIGKPINLGKKQEKYETPNIMPTKVQKFTRPKTQPSSSSRPVRQHPSPSSSSSDTTDESPPLHQPSKANIEWKPLFRSNNRHGEKPRHAQSYNYNGYHSAKESNRRGHVSSGDPKLDGVMRGSIRGRNAALCAPIDFDLEEEFDFAGNLQLFNKDDIDNEFYENVEKTKVSHNFGHDENIVNDPERCTSWVNAKKMDTSTTKPTPTFTPVSFEKTLDGFQLPVLSDQEKKQFLADATRLHGLTGMSSILADRVLQWTFDIAQRCRLDSNNVIIFASASTSKQLVEFLNVHFENRGCHPSIYGSTVENVNGLPQNAQMALILSDELPSEVWQWLLGREVHVVALDSAAAQIPSHRLHVLASGALSESLVSSPSQPRAGRTTFAMLAGMAPATPKIDTAVCDLRVPFNWFVGGTREHLSEAFASKLLMSVPKAAHLSLFSNETTSESFEFANLFTFEESSYGWFNISLAIFTWMALSYVMVYLCASLVCLVMTRKHPYSILLVLALLSMCLIGPLALGLTTSMILGFALSSTESPVSQWVTFLLGAIQTLLVILVSFSRILATL